jgi:predicted nucleotide-binding protein (sugar kinase/HSP70/actin superfamily)
MYSVDNYKYKNKYKLIDETELIDLEGFMMGSKNKVFKINGESIRDIKVIDKNLAYSLVTKQVSKKYEKLISYLTELLIDDDDSGETYREALNQIEKFRQEIKNKYRKYLKQKELEAMSKKLVILQKEANKRLDEIKSNLYKYENENRRSK